MKRNRVLAAAMVSIALTGTLASCGKEETYESENNANVCVYGPPPAYSDESGDNTADGEEFFAADSSEDTSEDTSEEEQTAASQGD